jgi:hypothetical protein
MKIDILRFVKKVGFHEGTVTFMKAGISALSGNSFSLWTPER